MRRAGRLAFLALLLVVLPAVAAAESTARLAVRTDRPDALYEKGETVTFLIELAEADEPVAEAEMDCELSTDGFRESERRRIAIAEGRARVTAKRDVPCILWIRATYRKEGAEPVRAVAGAAFSPEEIKPSMPPPDDFDGFWDRQKARLAGIPLNLHLEPMQSGDADVELFSIILDNINGTKVHGYLARPKREGPFAALLQVQWAGVYSLEPAWASGHAKQGLLALNINAHAIENGRPQQYYKELAEGALKDYPYQARDDRESCYFLRMYLSCVRAAEYLAWRPDWDGQHLIAFGGSQGGAQALVTAALSPDVTAVAAHVPALCDLTGRVLPDRAPGWPMMVALKDGKPDPVQMEVARYFDTVNFAGKVKVPVLVGTGFADLACPSSSVYAAYNVLPGPKRMVLDPLSGHVGRHPNWSRQVWKFVRENSRN